MQRKNVLFSISMTSIICVLAFFLYIFTYNTIKQSFFEATVNHTLETIQVIRDLGIKRVDHNLIDLKTSLKTYASEYSEQLINGSDDDFAAVLSEMELPEDGIDYWYCTPQGMAVNTEGLVIEQNFKLDLKEVFNGDDAIIFDPYFDENKEYIFSIAAPIKQNGQTVAALLLQMDGFCLSRWIEDLQFPTGDGLGYMITGEGRNIATSKEINYDWITGEYNSLEIENPDEGTKTVAAVERLPLEGKSGWGSYLWEGYRNYLVYAPMKETDWGFFVGFYGDTLGKYIQGVASKSTASSLPLILSVIAFLAILAIYTNHSLNKEKSYTKELLRQKLEIQKQAEELSVSEERFRVALERTSSIIFEYNLQTGKFVNFRTTKEVEHYENSVQNLREGLVLGGVIDNESASLLEECLNEINQGMEKSECNIKVLLSNGEAVWYRVSISSVHRHGRGFTRAIGILEDITKEKMADLDPLTGILNKKILTEQIANHLRQMTKTETCAFLMFDIDNFKLVNDTYGHPAGDQVIIQVAGILKDVFYQNALVGRVGGDEFCVFCYSSPSAKGLEDRLDIVRRQMKQQFEQKYDRVAITYSCGVAFCSEKNKEFDGLYQEADTALYQAKKDGKNRYVLRI